MCGEVGVPDTDTFSPSLLTPCDAASKNPPVAPYAHPACRTRTPRPVLRHLFGKVWLRLAERHQSPKFAAHVALRPPDFDAGAGSRALRFIKVPAGRGPQATRRRARRIFGRTLHESGVDPREPAASSEHRHDATKPRERPVAPVIGDQMG